MGTHPCQVWAGSLVEQVGDKEEQVIGSGRGHLGRSRAGHREAECQTRVRPSVKARIPRQGTWGCRGEGQGQRGLRTKSPGWNGGWGNGMWGRRKGA